MAGVKQKRYRLVIIFALIGLLLTGAQLVFSLLHGENFCLNQGCQIVESYTGSSPIVTNAIGFIFFLAILSLSLLAPKSEKLKYLLWTLLLAGAGAEGIFLGFQLFVAKALCSYCLLILSLVVLIILSFSPKAALQAGAIFMAQLLVFSILNFQKTTSIVQYSLNNGTYAIKSCTKPVKELYLIFSTECPHCQNVLNALKGCSRCELHLNPIKPIEKDLFPDLKKSKNYTTDVNVLALKVLGIQTIPVLVVKNPNGLTFITGDKPIISFIEEHCFGAGSQLDQLWDAPLLPEEEGVCSLETTCSE